MARMIDGDKLMELFKEQYLCNKSMKHREEARAWQGAIQLLYDMPTLTQPNEGGKDKNVPTNEPLTLEELSLCNDPVWIKRIGDEDLSGDGWAIVEGPRCLTWFMGIPMSWEIRVWWPGSEVADYPKPEDYGKIWFAYRRPPEREA